MAAYTRAASLSNRDETAILRLARLHRTAGDIDAACSWYSAFVDTAERGTAEGNDASAAEPDIAEALLFMGRVALDEGSFDAANTFARRVLMLPLQAEARAARDLLEEVAKASEAAVNGGAVAAGSPATVASVRGDRSAGASSFPVRSFRAWGADDSGDIMEPDSDGLAFQAPQFGGEAGRAGDWDISAPPGTGIASTIFGGRAGMVPPYFVRQAQRSRSSVQPRTDGRTTAGESTPMSTGSDAMDVVVSPRELFAASTRSIGGRSSGGRSSGGSQRRGSDVERSRRTNTSSLR